jgi:hypothetical protein
MVLGIIASAFLAMLAVVSVLLVTFFALALRLDTGYG